MWADVVGYEGIYKVNERGDIWSCVSKRLRKTRIDRYGYVIVSLYKSRNSKTALVHRIVASAFIPNPDNLPQINHIDENPQNNNVCNLEWCTSKYNSNYGTAIQRRIMHQDFTQEYAMRNVICYSKFGDFIKEYKGVGIAANAVETCRSNIISCCKGKSKTARGYVWRYK